MDTKRNVESGTIGNKNGSNQDSVSSHGAKRGGCTGKIVILHFQPENAKARRVARDPGGLGGHSITRLLDYSTTFTALGERQRLVYRVHIHVQTGITRQ